MTLAWPPFVLPVLVATVLLVQQADTASLLLFLSCMDAPCIRSCASINLLPCMFVDPGYCRRGDQC
jgi:hypothetical protein